jgi:hypothetical protein
MPGQCRFLLRRAAETLQGPVSYSVLCVNLDILPHWTVVQGHLIHTVRGLTCANGFAGNAHPAENQGMIAATVEKQ